MGVGREKDVERRKLEDDVRLRLPRWSKRWSGGAVIKRKSGQRRKKSSRNIQKATS